MIKQLIIGLIGEGTTDYRFLNSIVRRTFEELAFECKGDVEILDIIDLEIDSAPFVEYVYNASKEGFRNHGIMVLCFHPDSDSKDDSNVFQHKINPAFKYVSNSDDDDLCKNLVPIVPIVMTESWLLADKDLFLDEICTDKTFGELELPRNSEEITDPKKSIKEAIIIAHPHSRRRKRLTISELYLPIGQKAKLEELKSLASYSKFRTAAMKSLINLGYMGE